MEDVGYWVTPLLLIPGVAMLLLSTSIRYNRLHDEVHELGQGHATASRGSVERLLRRARLFRAVLVSLYVGVGLLALAGLFGGVAVVVGTMARWVSLALTGISVGAVVCASIMLVLESRLSLDVIERHLDGQQTRDP